MNPDQPTTHQVVFTRVHRELVYGVEHFDRTVQTALGPWTGTCSCGAWEGRSRFLDPLERAAAHHETTARNTPTPQHPNTTEGAQPACPND